MDSTKIIALDLGKFKTVACVMNVSDQSHVFETIEMSPASVHELLVRHATHDPADTLVVFDGPATAAAGCTISASHWPCRPRMKRTRASDAELLKAESRRRLQVKGPAAVAASRKGAR